MEDAQTRRTVICPSCNEAVPIKNAPAGRKYVRCHCNALLVAKTTSSRVGCPRPTCAKEVNLMPDRAFFINVPELSRVVCTFCRRVFLCNTIYTNYPRCPHCRYFHEMLGNVYDFDNVCNYRRLSSIDGEQSTSYGKKFLFGALLLFCLGVGVVVAIRSTEVGLCVLYVALFLAAIILALCGMYYCNLPTSRMIEYP